jgi:hypothetical protein
MKNVARVGVAAGIALASLAVIGWGTAAAVPTVNTTPGGGVWFTPHGNEWWTCVAGSLAAPYVSIQVPQLGPAPQFAQFSQGIDVGVACAGSHAPYGYAKIVRGGH